MDLLAWFQVSQRDYPWRNTTDPYKILLAEKLLQQTRANKVVVSVFLGLIERYPSIDTLADGNPEDLHAIIKPLGLSFRAKQILHMANQISEKHNGNVPNSYQALMELNGIGEYCSRAVLSFAYNHDVAIVDVNVGRVLHRVYNLGEEVPVNPSRKKYLVDLAQQILPKGQSRNFNLAILDLGASVCVPKRPKCFECPVEKYCEFENKSSF